VSDPVLRSHQVGSDLATRVKILRDLVYSKESGVYNPLMRQIGLLVTEGCKARADMCELRAIFDFVVKNVRYTGDITRKDTFAGALRTLQYGGGDCDDHSVVCATLALENGFTPKWRITSNTGKSWDHIYCMVGFPKNGPSSWVTLDTTLGPGRFDRQPPFADFRDFQVMT